MSDLQLYTKLQELLVLFFHLNECKGPQAQKQFEKLIKKWQLGSNKGPKIKASNLSNNKPQDEPFNTSIKNLSDKNAIATIKSLTHEIHKHIEPILINLVCIDIHRACMADGKISPLEQQALEATYSILEPQIKKNKQTGFYNVIGMEFKPKHTLIALGYLFWAAVVIDGHIDASEKDKIIENLKAWRDENSRVLFSALKLARIINKAHSKKNKNIFKNENFKKSIINCIDFLKQNEPTVKLEFMKKQIIKILQADGHIHKNEQWLYNKLNEYWEI